MLNTFLEAPRLGWNQQPTSYVLDEQASTFQEAAVLGVLRRSLITWQPESTIAGTVRLVLQII